MNEQISGELISPVDTGGHGEEGFRPDQGGEFTFEVAGETVTKPAAITDKDGKVIAFSDQGGEFTFEVAGETASQVSGN